MDEYEDEYEDDSAYSANGFPEPEDGEDDLYSASAVAPRSYIRPNIVEEYRGLEIVRVGDRYRIFWPGAGRFSLSRVSFLSLEAARKWIDAEPESTEPERAENRYGADHDAGDLAYLAKVGVLLGLVSFAVYGINYYLKKGGN